LDRNRLAEFAGHGPRTVFASVSGAHLYGFASRDSDVDLRGAFLHPLRAVLSLRPPKETIAIEEKTDIELDWVAHDLRKFVRMLTENNGYVLEQLYSPLVVVESPTFTELRELARGCVTRPTAKHYLGFGHGRRKRLHEPEPTVKHLLYGYRVYLTGIHLMQTGDVISNLPQLNDIFRLSQIDELIPRKRQGEEKEPLLPREIDEHVKCLDDLERALQRAYDESQLPDAPLGATALEDLVIKARLATLE
jgi:predicted nucleotidyltransferase